MDDTTDSSTTSDGGFTLVEVVVAMFVLTVALLALIPVQTKALSGVVLAAERQQATAYADGALERVRGRASTPAGFDQVADGRLPTSTDAGDLANTSGCPSACHLRPTSDPALDEVLKTDPSPDGVLATETATPSGTVFTTRLYVTGATPVTAPALVTVTSITSWTSRNGSGGQRQVAVRTQIASPTS